jgi:cell fate regulator YaaT (PSP1 superfamily)
MIGGLGICGRPFCCSQFLDDFHPVSIKMAKEQGLSLNPSKISGTCGRLLCCLKYEQDSYEYLNKITPRVGSIVDTKEGRGTVVESNLLTGKLKVSLERRPEALPSEYTRKEVKLVKRQKFNDENTAEATEE